MSVCFMLGFWCGCSYRNTARAAQQGLRRFHASTNKTPIMIIFSKNWFVRRDFQISVLDGCLEKKQNHLAFWNMLLEMPFPKPPHCCVKIDNLATQTQKHTHTHTAYHAVAATSDCVHPQFWNHYSYFWGTLPHQLDMCSPFCQLNNVYCTHTKSDIVTCGLDLTFKTYWARNCQLRALLLDLGGIKDNRPCCSYFQELPD